MYRAMLYTAYNFNTKTAIPAEFFEGETKHSVLEQAASAGLKQMETTGGSCQIIPVKGGGEQTKFYLLTSVLDSPHWEEMEDFTLYDPFQN